MKQARRRMSRINNIILKLPPKTREKVLLLRDKYDVLMKLDANTSREVARKAILLNYINSSGRKLFSDIHEDIRNSPSGEKQIVYTRFRYAETI